MPIEPRLSLADLETFDPYSPARGRERRFLCPLCGQVKPKDGGHRSLAANIETGVWNCHRCSAKGKLLEWWTVHPARERQGPNPRVRAAFSVPPVSVPARTPSDPHREATWSQLLAPLRPLPGTVGAQYLDQRGISVILAQPAGVRFSPSWYGRPAVVFPLRNAAGELVAAQGRYTDGGAHPKTRTAQRVEGFAKHGVFATSWGREACPLLLTEAPLDALSLAACGYPALAAIGCELPSWVPRFCAFREVLIATDADEAGDKAAARWKALLKPFGAKVERLRPSIGKDWNELLQRDPVELRVALRGLIPPVSAGREDLVP